MPLKSPFPSVEIPDCSIVSYTFTSPTHPLSKDRPLYIDTNDTSNFLTHHAYRLYAQRLAAGLRRNGFKPGDRLLLYSGNTIYFPVIVMGVIMAGGVFTGANPTYVAREVAYQLEDSGAKFMLVATGSLDTGLEAASQVGLSKSSVCVFDGQSRGEPVQGTRHWSSLLASEIDGQGFTWDPCTSPEESERTIALNYSSGTTGPPKGVEITHKNYVANCTQVKAHQDRQVKTKEEEENETFLGIVPMYHALGQTWFVVRVPTLAAKCYVMPKFEFEKVMDAIEKFRVTSLSLVPPIVVAMAKHPDVRRGKWDLSSVRTVHVGAAPLGSEACREFDGLFNQNRSPSTEINIKQGWGMTEGTCTLVFFDPTKKSLSYSVGSPLPNTELKFMNDDGTAEVPPHEHGEIWVKAPNVMKGYWRNEKATEETLTPDGWLKSGDIGYFDKDGLVYIVDRRKELIKVKGNQVAPAELEALLLDHPAVNDAAVIGVPHNGDEAPRAYIVLNAGGSATAEDIQSWVEKRVSRHKRLKGGVRFVDQVPKNPSGKILRKFLREKAAKEMKGERPRL